MVEVERNNEYASRGVANTGLGLGIAGTALGLLNGGLNGLWAANPLNANCAGTCNENMPVNRYELQLQQQLAAKDAQISLRDANSYGDQKMLEMYKYIDGQLKDIRSVQSAQAVHNQKTEDSFVLARQDIACVEERLNEKIKMEAERRCCADNSIVTYANATFYPKMVADVTTGTATTPQSLYNPLPKCGGCCGN